VVRPGEVDYLEREHLGAVVAHVFEGDRRINLLEGNKLSARDHSIERVWATLELVTGKPQPLEGVEVHEVEATTPIHEGLGEPSRPNQWVDYEGKPPWLWDAIRVVHSVKSDQRFRAVWVL
jgi:hypothetical protein